MKVLVLGCGQVGSKVIKQLELFKNINIYCFAKNKRESYNNVTFLNTYKDLLNPDIVVETLPGKSNIDVEFAYVIVKQYLENGIDVVSCNKMMIQRKGKELCEIAKTYQSKFMLSSLMAIDYIVDENNFYKFGEELYRFRGKNSEVTASSIIKDINILIKKEGL